MKPIEKKNPQGRKLVSVMVPCYNEAENVEAITAAIIHQMEALPQYAFEVLLIDNCSTDGTREIIRRICAGEKRVKAIFNVKNFGQFNSPYYALLQCHGDCAISICADFQDPVEMIPEFLRYWEEGYQIVCGVKTSSKESRLMYGLRTIYYKLIKKFSAVDQIEHFTGFGLYDKAFVDVIRNVHDPMPYLRGMIAELGFDYKTILYDRPNRRAGKSKNNFYTLYDYAMVGITSYSKVVLRIATFIGFFIGLTSIIVALVYLILKLIHWDWFHAGIAPLVIGQFFLGGVQLFFIGLMGEYILSINTRVLGRPLVVEEERLNFDDDTPVAS